MLELSLQSSIQLRTSSFITLWTGQYKRNQNSGYTQSKIPDNYQLSTKQVASS